MLRSTHLARYSLAICLPLAVACSSSNKQASGAGASSGSSQATPAKESLIDKAIEALEGGGKVPKLDRSDDLMGPDVDKDGVRDDIAAYIKSLNLRVPQENAALQLARAQQVNMATNPDDPEAVRAATATLMRGIFCVGETFSLADGERHSQLVDSIEKYSKNTKARAQHSMALDRAFGGKTMRAPSGKVCDQ
jgi:hypothetical protein